MTKRTVTVNLGINGAFITRRWEEPENWMRLTRECGFNQHSFCGDVIDPFFSGDREFQLEQATAAKEAAKRYGVKICDFYTGVATHRFLGLSHRDERARRRMMEWVEGAAEIAAAMGTDRLGGHVDAFSVEVLSDPQLTKEAVARQYQTIHELAVRLKSSGIRCLMVEQMYIPSEKPYTLAECEEFLIETNRGFSGIPVIVTLDVGHQAGEHYGLSGADTDYVEWVRRFGAVSEIIHLQQTTRDASHHWPFTDEYNRRGHIKVDAVLKALWESHQRYAQQPYASVLPPVKEHVLVAEIIPGSTKTEAKLLAELKESAEYLADFVPEDGLQWEFER